MKGGYIFENIGGYTEKEIFYDKLAITGDNILTTSIDYSKITDKIKEYRLDYFGYGKEKEFYKNTNAKYLIITNINEIGYTLPEFALENNFAALIEGLNIILSIFAGASKFYITYDCDDSEFTELFKEQNFKIFEAENRYPETHPVILAEKILNRDLSVNAPELGEFQYFRIDELFYIGEAFINNSPNSSRWAALLGAGFKKNMFIRINYGEPLSALLEKFGVDNFIYLKNNVLSCDILNTSYIIDNSVYAICSVKKDTDREFLDFIMPGLTKDAYYNVFISKLASLILPVKIKFDTKLHGEHRECINCLACSNVCPRLMLPHLLVNIIKIKEFEEAYNLNALECIECGLCSYVCPSKIEVADIIKSAKTEIIKEVSS